MRIVGTVNIRLVPFDERFGITPFPNSTVFPVAVNPVPVIVTLVPGWPEEGDRDAMVSGDGAKAVEPW